jgi:uncharacterized protein YifE (UPF0438 family)
VDRREFDLPVLARLKYLFSAAEEVQIKKYGSWARSLEMKVTPPSTERQEHFVSVCLGLNQPETDFEFLWLRLRFIIETDRQITGLEDSLVSAKADANGLRKSLFENLDKYKTELQYQQELVKKLQGKLTSYERRLGISEPPRTDVTPETGPREVCPNCCGDGGASGQCFKCGGTGWFFSHV